MRRHTAILVILLQTALLVGLILAVQSGRIPLGVNSEWEWLRISIPSDIVYQAMALIVVGFYAAYACFGVRRLATRPRATGLLIGLVPLAILTQVAVQEAAPEGYGLAKWAIALADKGSSGYHSIAKAEIQELKPFLKNYPTWINGQDSLHIGTHPPGLFMVSWSMLHAMEAYPEIAKTVVGLLPNTLNMAFNAYADHDPLSMAERAGIALTGLLIMLACSLTIVPLYYLARAKNHAPVAWIAAVLWPLVPAAMMFQPTADTAFPLLSTTALALAAWTFRRPWLALLAGITLGIGTQFTLAFFPVGLIVAIVYLVEPASRWRNKAILIGMTGLGFLGVTGLAWLWYGSNPLTIWIANAANHARFYQQYTRSYGLWVIVNPIELAVALGLPTVVLMASGASKGPRVAWATLGVMAFLTFSGKNLSEVARLWLPLMPPLLVMAGAGFVRLAARPLELAAMLVLLAIQTLYLECVIQVIYPV